MANPSTSDVIVSVDPPVASKPPPPSLAYLQFPEKYYVAANYVDAVYAPLETTPLLSDGHKLAFYALKQQSEKGKNEGSAPYWWHVKERAMFDAWSMLGKMSKMEAMFQFVSLLEDVDKDWYGKSCAMGEKTAAVETSALPTDGATTTGSTSSMEGTVSAAPVKQLEPPVSPPSNPPVQVKSRPVPASAPLSPSIDGLEDALLAQPYDAGLSHAVTAENVEFLISEVVRLRRWLSEVQQPRPYYGIVPTEGAIIQPTRPAVLSSQPAQPGPLSSTVDEGRGTSGPHQFSAPMLPSEAAAMMNGAQSSGSPTAPAPHSVVDNGKFLPHAVYYGAAGPTGVASPGHQPPTTSGGFWNWFFGGQSGGQEVPAGGTTI